MHARVKREIWGLFGFCRVDLCSCPCDRAPVLEAGGRPVQGSGAIFRFCDSGVRDSEGWGVLMLVVGGFGATGSLSWK